MITDTPMDLTRLPRHIGIIMDGNRRWAKRNKLKTALGHSAGTKSLREIIRNASAIGIEALSLYAFSTENWQRSQAEVDALMALLLSFFHSDIDELIRKNVHILIVGDLDAMPAPQRDALHSAQQRTRDNTGLKLCIAVNYGSRQELTRAARLLAGEVQAGTLAPEQINEDAMAAKLYTAGIPDVDLLIRTSGEMRLSNFMLWQCAYAEFIFPEVLWPDFTVNDFHTCIAAFQSRSRRFGGRPQDEQSRV